MNVKYKIINIKKESNMKKETNTKWESKDPKNSKEKDKRSYKGTSGSRVRGDKPGYAKPTRVETKPKVEIKTSVEVKSKVEDRLIRRGFNRR